MAHDGESRRTFLKTAGAAAAAASLAGCSGGGGQDTETTTDSTDTTESDEPVETTTEEETDTPEELPDFPVTITQGQMPTTLDPHNHRSTPTDNVLLHVYEGLMARSRSGAVQASLATEWSRQEDGVVRFQLRDDVTFHSGNDLTPEDVAFSINRIVQEDVSIASPQSDQLAGVTGATAVDGEHAVDVQSDGFNPIVFSLFASFCDVVEQAWVEEREKSEVAQQMNGTGPFEIDTYEENVQVRLVRNEDYWDDPATVSELTFRAAEESSTRVNQLLEGETDIVVNVPPQEISRVRDASGASVAAVGSTRLLFSAMRYDVEPFSNQSFRQAMNYAIDIDAIIENVLSGFAGATAQPTLEGFFGHNGDLDPYPQDQAQAEQLVEDSGHAGASITLHTPIGRYLKDVEIAQAVGSQIDELSNVSCEVNQREFSALAGEVTDGNIETSPHFYLLGWGNTTFDASQTILPLLTADGALTSYQNDEVDSTMSDAQSESDQDTRDQLLQEANQLLHDQSAWVFLNRQYSVYGVRNRVQWEARNDERIDAYAMSPNE